uniref:Innexin n=1 Tax=Panagrolaimus sp. PS1159 TaxID=55785 RepID=A0AC35ETN2_9BILA
MFFHATLARTFIQSLRVRGDDDIVDRLNYYYTPIMLAISCLIISAKQYGGKPIDCWTTPHNEKTKEEYIESYCWITNTYWVPMYENIPDDHTAREGQQIGYYQWVPFILIAEALMFSLPCILWRLLNSQSGLNIQNVVAASCEARTIVDPIEREKVIEAISASVIDIIDLQDQQIKPHPSSSWMSRIKFNSFLNGHYVTILYVFIKICYTTNIMVQFMLLNAALKSSEYMFFGFQVLSDLLNGKPWSESGHFPRVTLCDFEIRHLANLNRYTVQCALLINILNEKVFAFFWCWYLLLAIVTTISTLFWITSIIFPSERIDYILTFMQIAESSDKKRRQKPINTDSLDSKESFEVPESMLLEKFVLDFLKSDGVFTLRLMANHAGELIVVNVVKNLWQEFRDRNLHKMEDFYQHRKSTYNCIQQQQPTSLQQQQQRLQRNSGGGGGGRFVEVRYNLKSNHSSISEPPVIVSNPHVTNTILSDSLNEKAINN